MHLVALTLRFDAATELAVRDLWARIAAAGFTVAGLHGHRPHITLAAYDVDDVETARSILDDALREERSFPIRLHALGVFPEPRVVFLAPYVTDALFSLHAKILDRFAAHGHTLVYDHLEHNDWIPHCTLCVDLPPQDVAPVVDLCIRTWQPITGTVEAVGLLVSPVTEDVAECALARHTAPASGA
jgi:2'-5' RNA ligase